MNSLSIAVQPVVEPVTLADAKAFLRVDLSDDDALIGGLIASARQTCEMLTARTFITTTYTLTMGSFPFGGGYCSRWNRQNPTLYNFTPGAGEIRIPRPPFQSIVNISYLGADLTSQTLATSAYRVIAGTENAPRLLSAFNTSWPVVAPFDGAVTITYKAGYGDDPSDVPAGIQTAIKLLTSHMYNHRDAVSDTPMSTVPMGIDYLLGPYIVGTY